MKNSLRNLGLVGILVGCLASGCAIYSQPQTILYKTEKKEEVKLKNRYSELEREVINIVQDFIQNYDLKDIYRLHKDNLPNNTIFYTNNPYMPDEIFEKRMLRLPNDIRKLRDGFRKTNKGDILEIHPSYKNIEGEGNGIYLFHFPGTFGGYSAEYHGKIYKFAKEEYPKIPMTKLTVGVGMSWYGPGKEIIYKLGEEGVWSKNIKHIYVSSLVKSVSSIEESVSNLSKEDIQIYLDLADALKKNFSLNSNK